MVSSKHYIVETKYDGMKHHGMKNDGMKATDYQLIGGRGRILSG